MEQQKTRLLLMLLFLLVCSTGSNEDQNYWSPSIPKTWDETALATFSGRQDIRVTKEGLLWNNPKTKRKTWRIFEKT